MNDSGKAGAPTGVRKSDRASRPNSIAREKGELPSKRELWLSGQSNAFKAAISGASLKECLDILISTAIEQIEPTNQCAFYLANEEGTELSHVTGMSDNYAEHVEGFKIGPESFGCGLALSLNEPVITPDVRNEPRWQDWLWLAEEAGYRGVWSFPVQTIGGKLVGTFAMYFREPRSPTRADLQFADSLCGTASIIIAQHQSREAVRESEVQLAALVEALPIGIGLTNQQGEMVICNQEMLRFLPSERIPSRDPDRGWRWRSWDKDGELVNPNNYPGARALRGESVIPGLEMLYTNDDGREVWTNVSAAPVRDSNGRIKGQFAVINDIDALKRTQQQQKHLLAELQHRVRNTLAVIRSIVRRTAVTSESVEHFEHHLDGRLAAFARTQSYVTRDPQGGVDLELIVRDELQAHASGDSQQISIDGPEVRLPVKHAETLALALHELTSNAIKYGALTSDGNQIDVVWSMEEDASGPMLHLSWIEQLSEPRLGNPSRTGFGTELLVRVMQYELDAETKLDFRPDGLSYTARIPMPPPPNSETKSLT